MRVRGLDFIRGLAVLLVLLRHAGNGNALENIGWVGVDLFFVLSGFLISSLVFREFQKSHDFDAKRFLIRRGFKIYPAFFFFLIISLLINYFEHGISYEPRIILAEVFFLQSYLPHVWTHTWSIAVEEHFYFAMALMATWQIRKWKPEINNRLLYYLLVVLIAVFFMRFIVCYPKRFLEEFSFFSTHLRMDGIVVGVLAAYLIHFKGFDVKIKKYRWYLFIMFCFLAWPPFVFKGGSFFMNTIGLTLMNFSFGILVLLASQVDSITVLVRSRLLSLFPEFVCFIGIHSYSIYLWHLLVQQELFRFHFSAGLNFWIYVTTSLLIGVFFSYAIEKPSLLFRERFIFSKTVK